MISGGFKISEKELVARAVDGDAEAFGDLYERHLDEIYRYIALRVSDRFEAEDLTETAFLKAWEALPAIRGRELANFRAWLYRIAHNLVIDRHRTKKIVVSLDDSLPFEDENPLPESATQANEQKRHLAALLSRLSPKLQDVLACRFMSGMSHAETAQVLGVKEGNVRVMQYRALRALRDLLKEEA